VHFLQREFMMKLLQLILIITFSCKAIDCKEILESGEKSKILSKLKKIKDGGRKQIEFQVSDKVSVSSTFYIQIFCTNVVLAAFSTYM